MINGSSKFFSGLLISVLLSSCGDKGQLPVAGVSRQLAENRKEAISDVVYSLHFSIPADKNAPLSGSAVIKFTLNDPEQAVILDFNAPAEKLKTLEVNNKDMPVRWKNEHLIIPADHLSVHNTVKIIFEPGDRALNRNDDFLYSLFVPERASTCFPVFDQPDIKARYKLSLTIPSGWRAVSNGKLLKKENHIDRIKYTFSETRPISSYLFSFVAGDFEVIRSTVGGRVMNLYHRETDSLKLADNANTIFNWHDTSLKWLESYTGIPYPFEKFDFVLIPSFQYSGMEHPGVILYDASSLLLDRSSTLTEQLDRARLIAHETAHMWFGNLVTMKWFDDVWLKEVFANFMAAKIVNPGFPQVNHDLQFLMAHYPGAYHIDRTAGTHPIQQSLDNLKHAGTLYGNIIYRKAPIVMRMLEENIGSEAFHKGIAEYLRTYSFSNASWDDLIAILDRHASYDLEEWNDFWVRSAGMPVISYSFAKRRGSGELDFKRTGAGKGTKPRQDLEIFIGHGDSVNRLQAPLLTDDKNSIQLAEYRDPEFIFPNGSGKAYGYFKLDSISTSYLLQRVDHLKDPLLRASVWINFYEAMLRGHISPYQLMGRAMKSLTQEKEEIIAEYITNLISTIYWTMYNKEQRRTLAPRLEGLLLNMTLHASSTNLKSTYYNGFKSIAISSQGVQILKQIWEGKLAIDGLPLSENDLTDLVFALAIREAEGFEKMLEEQRKAISNPDRIRKFDFIRPAVSADTVTRDIFFESLKQPANRHNEAWVAEALGYLHHPLRAASAVKYILPSLELLQEVEITGDIFFPERWLSSMLNGHNSREASEVVKKFIADHPGYPERLRNKILQSADMLFRSVQLRSG